MSYCTPTAVFYVTPVLGAEWYILSKMIMRCVLLSMFYSWEKKKKQTAQRAVIASVAFWKNCCCLFKLKQWIIENVPTWHLHSSSYVSVDHLRSDVFSLICITRAKRGFSLHNDYRIKHLQTTSLVFAWSLSMSSLFIPGLKMYLSDRLAMGQC